VKTQDGIRLFAFRSHEVGAHYIGKLGPAGDHLDIVAIEAGISSVPEHERTSEGIVFIRSIDEADLYLMDRSGFPHRDYEMSLREIEKYG
jgi:hypothetical protein